MGLITKKRKDSIKIIMNEFPLSLIKRGYIKIGTHWDGRACGLGDVVMVTALIRELHNALPDLKIHVRVLKYLQCFYNNPKCDSIEIGRGENSETACEGHYIEKLCDWFALKCENLYGELFLTNNEIRDANKLFETNREKLCVHIGNPTHFSINACNKFISSFKQSKYEVIQLDLNTYRGIFVPEIAGANQNFRNVNLRTLFACISLSKYFIGANSGPMHIAVSFQIPSLIFATPELTKDMLYPQNMNLPLNEFLNKTKEIVEGKRLLK